MIPGISAPESTLKVTSITGRTAKMNEDNENAHHHNNNDNHKHSNQKWNT